MSRKTVVALLLLMVVSLGCIIGSMLLNLKQTKEYRDKINELTKKVETLEKSYIETANLYNELEVNYDKLENTNTDLVEQINELTNENTALQENNDTKQEQIEKNKETIEQKNKEIEQLKVDLKNAEARKKEREAAAAKEKAAALSVSGSFQGVQLQYSKAYNVTDNKLTATKGVVYYNGHKECYYTQTLLPGKGLYLPGRHVAEDGTIRDGDGYICVAADLKFLPRYSTVMTSLGPGKVYDTGCRYGTVDIYTDW